MTALTLDIKTECWPIAGGFTISRGTKHEAHVVVVTVKSQEHCGRGECVPYARYGQSIASVVATLNDVQLSPEWSPATARKNVHGQLPPGAARNALDCALWDLEAKQTGSSCAALAGLAPLATVTTMHTIGLGPAEEMAAKAAALRQFPILKLKLDGQDEDARRMAMVRAARRDAELIVDANEAWSNATIVRRLAQAADAGIALIEQPLPAGADQILADIDHVVAICADESAHVARDVGKLVGRYDAINIKLDKTGGLTEAVAMAEAARGAAMQIMIGCMVSSSLSMAPALLIAQNAEWVDLDGPLLLAQDCPHPLHYNGPVVSPPLPALWG